MRMLTARAYARARRFVADQARPLDRALCAYEQDGDPSAQRGVSAALATFQNADGGLGRGLEPDFRLSASSVLATTVGLQYAVAAGLGPDDPVVAAALAYLTAAWDPSSARFPAVPEAVNREPHAPWWSVDPGTGRCSVEGTWANPNAEVVGYLWRFGASVPEAFRVARTEQALAELEAIAAPLDLHDFLCYARLAEALPAELADRILRRLHQDVASTVDREPERWRTYGAKPLTLAPTPATPFAPDLADALAQNLDFEIEAQTAAGGWRPNWSWAEADGAAWEIAEREWAGSLTVATLRSLKAFGRIA